MNKKIDSIDAFIIDSDGTTKDVTPTAEYLGRELLKEQLTNPISLLRGMWGYLKVKRIQKTNGENGDGKALKKFTEIVGNNLDIDRETVYEMTRKILKEKEIPGFSDYNSRLREQGYKVFLSTAGPDSTGYASLDLYDMDGFNANPMVWQRPNGELVSGNKIVNNNHNLRGLGERDCNLMLRGCEIPIKNSEDKKSVTEQMIKNADLDWKQVAVIGNDDIDHRMLETCGLPMASPLADYDTKLHVKRLDGILLTDYSTFTK